ncbi:MAG: Mpo1-like protein [Nostoc sp.]|uniref:Mpo1-like protein n=1 Tax=Nostoc sp. TaxID=1180 RepID=UPI002FFBD152
MSNINSNPQQSLRNRINNQILDHPFTDYWDIFILKHQHPINITLHIWGILFFYGLLFYTCKSQNFWLLLGLPLTQFLGLTGHFFFERSHIDLQDAVFSWRASYCLGKMLFRILMGKYQDDIRQRQEILNNYISKNYANIQ